MSAFKPVVFVTGIANALIGMIMNDNNLVEISILKLKKIIVINLIKIIKTIKLIVKLVFFLYLLQLLQTS